MAKITPLTIAGGYNLSTINTNFQELADELQDKVLYRDNPVGEPNTMENDMDMNSYRILNLQAPSSPNDAARLADIQDAVAGTATAAFTSFAPTSDIIATNVQEAIEEVWTDLYVRLRDETFFTDPLIGGVIGAADNLGPWNVMVGLLNAGTIKRVYFPYGTINLSAEPTAITGTGLTLEFSGLSTLVQFNVGAGTAGTFFKLGSAGTQASNITVMGGEFKCLNTATLSGNNNVFDLVNASTIKAEKFKVTNVNGLAMIGNSTNATAASDVDFRNITGTFYGPANGRVVEGVYGNNYTFTDIRIVPSGVAGASVLGVWLHPSGDRTLDKGRFTNCEFDFTGQVINYGSLINATGGAVSNQMFTNCYFGSCTSYGVWVYMDTGGLAANAKVDNVVFNNCRVSTLTSGVPISIDNSTTRLCDVQVIGGSLTCPTAEAIKVLGTTRVRISGTALLDSGGVTARPAITSTSEDLIVTGGTRATASTPTGTCAFTYGVAYTANTSRGVIVGNDFSDVTISSADTSINGVTLADQLIIANNLTPNSSHVKTVTTTNNTATNISTLPLTDERTYYIEAVVCGVKSDGTQRASYKIAGTFYRTAAGFAVQQGSTTTLHSAESDALWNASFNVTGSSNLIQVRVTGVAGTTIKWGCTLTTVSILEP